MAAGIEIFDENGKLIMSQDDLTTCALGEATIPAWQNTTIQNDELIGQDFWFHIKHYSDYPNARFQKNLGAGYYMPELTYDKNSGTATFTWDDNVKSEMEEGGFTAFVLGMTGVADITIVYGGI